MELRHIFEILWRHQRLIIVVFMLVFLPIVLGSLLVTPRYESTAKVLIRKNVANFSILKSIGLHEQSITTTSLSDIDRADYLAFGNLRPVAEKAISDLHLQRIPVKTQAMLTLPGLKSMLGLWGVDLSAMKKDMTAEQLFDSSLLSAIFPRPYAEISQYEDTDILEIKAISTEPDEAMRLANILANNFIGEEQLRIRREYAGAKKFIENNIINARTEYEQALQAVIKLKEQEKILDSDTETTTLVEKKADFKEVVRDNNLAIASKKAAIQNMQTQLKTTTKFQKSSERLKANEAVRKLKENIQTLHGQKAEAEIKFTEEHPALIEINAKITENKKLLQQEIQKEFAEETVSVNPVYDDLTQKLSLAISELAGLESQKAALPIISDGYASEIARLPKKVADLLSLELAVTIAQDVYKVLLQHQYQITMAESAALSDLYLLESAVAADKGSSKHKRPAIPVNILLAVILGTMLAVGSALFLNYLDDTIKNGEGIKTGVTILGSIGKLRQHDSLLLNADKPNLLLNECIRGIRRAIDSAATASINNKSIAVISTFPLEGKSSFVANLAVSAARDGRKVLVVDGNFRQPVIQQYFKLSAGASLNDYINGTVELDKILSTTDIPGLDVIMADSTSPADPGRLVESAKLGDLIRQMEMAYDLVILDTPSLAVTSDALILGKYAAASILIVQNGRLRAKDLDSTISALDRANIHLIGVVLNNLQPVTAFSSFKKCCSVTHA